MNLELGLVDLDCLTLKDGTDILSRNVGNQVQPTPRNILEERRPQLHSGRGSKSRKYKAVKKEV